MKVRPKPPTAIDLFSGCGGLSEGLRQAKFNVIGAVEYEALAVETYRANHRCVEVWAEDITKVSIGTVLAKLKLKRGELDLLAGCPPCQGFSRLRTRNGSCSMDHPQNLLINEFLRFVDGLFPKTIMMENVPGLQSHRCFKDFRAGLTKLGYNSVQCEVKNAAHYGVPQRRRRLILLASRIGDVAFADPELKFKTVKEAISMLPPAGKSGDKLHDLKEKRSPNIQARIKSIPLDGGSRKDLGEEHQLDCHRNLKQQLKVNGFSDIYGRMAWEKVSPTITGGCFNPSKGRFLHPSEHRAITLREASILQGFPRRYRFPNVSNKGDVALMIGNALPPPFIAAHALKIKDTLSTSKRIRPDFTRKNTTQHKAKTALKTVGYKAQLDLPFGSRD